MSISKQRFILLIKKGFKMSIKKTSKKLIKELKTYINLNGFAKTAVALGYNDVNAIRNWVSRDDIPESKRDLVKNLPFRTVVVTELSVAQ